MPAINMLLDKYGESHQNGINKAIHWICVPTIMFSLMGLLYCIPFPFVPVKSIWSNWAAVAVAATWIYYFRLSIPMFIGFVFIGYLMLWGVDSLAFVAGDNGTMFLYCLLIFVVAWIFQFIGHKIEGKKPSFLEDVQFLLIGPAWLLHFVYDKIGIRY